MKRDLVNRKYLEIADRYLVHNYAPFPVAIAEGEGVWLLDFEGKQYLDLAACFSVLAFGHCYKPIVDALIDQVQLLHSPSRMVITDQLSLWAREITKFCGMDKILPMNTGVEAFEAAVKIARKWSYVKKGVTENQAEIIVCQNNFHGKSLAAISSSTTEKYKQYFGPFLPGFVAIPFGDSESLKKAITQNTAAFLVEPIQGEGGIIIPKKGYLKEVETICKENRVLLLLDEVQTGFYRTGRKFCYEHENVKPDILMIAKALGGGVPISAVLASEEITDVIQPGDHGSTFGGNPLMAAVSRAVLKEFKKRGDKYWIKKVSRSGEYFVNGLKEAIMNNKYVKDIDGRGLFIRVELTQESGGARRFCEALLKRGVLANYLHEWIIRLAPPLIIEKKEIDFALEAFKEVFDNIK